MFPYLLKDTASKIRIIEYLRHAVEVYAREAPLQWKDEDSLAQLFLSAITGRVATVHGTLAAND